MIWQHKDMIGRKRYGRIGVVALPYYLPSSFWAPRSRGSATSCFAWPQPRPALGSLRPGVLGLSLSYGLVLTFLAILMEERPSALSQLRDLSRLVFCSVIENFGYRQLLSVVRLRSWYTVTRNRRWGEMTRKGFGLNEPGDPLPRRQAAEPAIAARRPLYGEVMTTGTMLWAGKQLSEDEELRTRRLVALLHRVGDDDVAETFERFLPETTTAGRPISWRRAPTPDHGFRWRHRSSTGNNRPLLTS